MFQIVINKKIAVIGKDTHNATNYLSFKDKNIDNSVEQL